MEIKLYNAPEYDAAYPEYKKNSELFEGDHSVMTSAKYLPLHSLEEDISVDGANKARKTREALSRYTNFPKRAFRRYKSIIFQIDPVFDEEAQAFLEEHGLYDNIDGKGTNIISFIKNELFKNKFIYGDSFLLTTSQNDSPIWDSLTALNVKDYSVTNGKLSLFRYEYPVIEPRTSSTEKPKEMIYSDEFILEGETVKLNRYKKEKKQGQITGQNNAWEKDISDQVITGFTEIPIAFSFGDSFITDASNDILEYHNIKSSLMNQLYHQAFDRTIIAGNVDKDQIFAFSAYSVTIIRSTDGNQPTITNIPAADTTALRTQLAESGQNVLKSFYHYTRSIANDSGVGESAESQEAAKEDLLNVIKTEVADLERQSNQGLQHLATQAGVTNFNGTVTFNKKFNVIDLQAEINQELAYLGIAERRSQTLYKSILKKGVKRLNLENEPKIIEEIDAINLQTGQQEQPVIDINNI